jgi:propionate CoA-transferase
LKNKIVSAEETVGLVHDGDTLIFSGFGLVGVPDGLAAALAKRFVESGAPRDLTLFFGGGPGDGKDQGLNRLALEGLMSPSSAARPRIPTATCPWTARR